MWSGRGSSYKQEIDAVAGMLKPRVDQNCTAVGQWVPSGQGTRHPCDIHTLHHRQCASCKVGSYRGSSWPEAVWVACCGWIANETRRGDYWMDHDGRKPGRPGRYTCLCSSFSHHYEAGCSASMYVVLHSHGYWLGICPIPAQCPAWWLQHLCAKR